MWACLSEVCPNLRMRDLGVIDVDEGSLGLEIPNKSDSGGLASVACIGLERKT